MPRVSEQNKISHDGQSLTVEKNTIVERNWLPSADELKKINDISPEITKWMMKRVEEEQENRFKLNDKESETYARNLEQIHKYNFRALSMAFIIVLCFLGVSVYLISIGAELGATIISGGTLVSIVSYFIQRNKK